MHIKRNLAPKKWPIPRKGTVYVAKPRFNLSNGIPLLVVLRDVLKIAETRNEVKRAIHLREIFVNEKPIKDERHGMLLFDTLRIAPSKKNYRLGFSENGKFSLDEIKESEAETKISKVINKKTLKGRKTQLNLSDGRNFISDIKCDVNDSVLVDLKEGKITKCIPLKEKSNAIVFEGKHIGERGIVGEIDKKNEMAELEIKNHKVNVLIKQIMAVEN